MGQREALQGKQQRAGSDSPVLEAYRWMLTARLLDERLAAMYRAGSLYGGVFLGKGQEALSVALGQALLPTDIYAPLIRDGAGRLAFGESIRDALRNCLGSPLGPMRARDGNVHRGRPKDGYLPMLSHLGAMISVVGGMLLARRIRKVEVGVGATCIGDGGTSTGAFHEAINLAAVEKLPLVVVVANNHYAYSTPIEKQFACESLIDKAVGYGIDGHPVDGTDLLACQDVIQNAVERARNGKGPQLVVGELLRLCGHGEHDDAHYIDEELKSSKKGRDCLALAEEQLRDLKQVDDQGIESIRQSVLQEIEFATKDISQEAPPQAANYDWCALATRRLADPAR
jgi:pyruvate dehydrogenase E1 component alpha subunit/2-oxoisovalerate dehydrogenase E1 component alpha subunit